MNNFPFFFIHWEDVWCTVIDSFTTSYHLFWYSAWWTVVQLGCLWIISFCFHPLAHMVHCYWLFHYFMSSILILCSFLYSLKTNQEEKIDFFGSMTNIIRNDGSIWKSHLLRSKLIMLSLLIHSLLFPDLESPV